MISLLVFGCLATGAAAAGSTRSLQGDIDGSLDFGRLGATQWLADWREDIAKALKLLEEQRSIEAVQAEGLQKPLKDLLSVLESGNLGSRLGLSDDSSKQAERTGDDLADEEDDPFGDILRVLESIFSLPTGERASAEATSVATHVTRPEMAQKRKQFDGSLGGLRESILTDLSVVTNGPSEGKIATDTASVKLPIFATEALKATGKKTVAADLMDGGLGDLLIPPFEVGIGQSFSVGDVTFESGFSESWNPESVGSHSSIYELLRSFLGPHNATTSDSLAVSTTTTATPTTTTTTVKSTTTSTKAPRITENILFKGLFTSGGDSAVLAGDIAKTEDASRTGGLPSFPGLPNMPKLPLFDVLPASQMNPISYMMPKKLPAIPTFPAGGSGSIPAVPSIATMPPMPVPLPIIPSGSSSGLAGAFAKELAKVSLIGDSVRKGKILATSGFLSNGEDGNTQTIIAKELAKLVAV